MRRFVVFQILLLISSSVYGQSSNLITNIDHRETISLNGRWRIIIDPFEYGFLDLGSRPKEYGYFKDARPKDKTSLIEYDFDTSETLVVPGDWNSQQEKLFYYEGTIWYKKSFDYEKKQDKRLFVYFGAANYEAIVYLNGKKIGEHEGGFTPFNIEITNLVQPKDNSLIVKVDNKRRLDAIPPSMFGWWNFGGLTRNVMLVETAETFIRDYFIQLEKGSSKTITGWVQLDGDKKQQSITVEISEAGIKKVCDTNKDGYVEFKIDANLQLWSPDNPKLYNVIVKAQTDTVADTVGFRTIETKGNKILLNGKPIFLRGVCVHEESPIRGGRACTKEDAEILLSRAKELHCNYIRLGHLPANEVLIRTAEKMGILAWMEIPVFWGVAWQNEGTYKNAANQMTEMITRDKNRACVILWSVGNETLDNDTPDARLNFMQKLVQHVRSMDTTRLVAAAMFAKRKDKTNFVLEDPLGKDLDVLGCNEYVGWYFDMPEDCDNTNFQTIYDKPLIISEFGGDAVYGIHGDKSTRWTEEFQENVYNHQLKMLQRIPSLAGMSAWLLIDYRCPGRVQPKMQDNWNRKGLFSDGGEKKKAFFVLQEFYKNIEKNEKQPTNGGQK